MSAYKHLCDIATVWHKDLHGISFYGWWQNRKIEIRKLDGNLYIYHYNIEIHNIKIPSTFHPNDLEANCKNFYYHEVFVPYGS